MQARSTAVKFLFGFHPSMSGVCFPLKTIQREHFLVPPEIEQPQNDVSLLNSIAL